LHFTSLFRAHEQLTLSVGAIHVKPLYSWNTTNSVSQHIAGIELLFLAIAVPDEVLSLCWCLVCRFGFHHAMIIMMIMA
jgi:hypothetical protein